MEPVAIIFHNIQIYWSHIIAVLTAAVWFFSVLAFASAAKIRAAAAILLPVLVGALSFVLSRLLYWYTAAESYADIKTALTDPDPFAFNVTGVIAGGALAALFIRLIRLEKKLPAMFDALAVPAAAGIGMHSLVFFFGEGFKGNMMITDPAVTGSVFATALTDSRGNITYRFSSFFVCFLCMILIAVITSLIFFIRKEKDGTAAGVFLLLYSSSQFIIDSTRYDSGYFSFNGFVSIIQIFSGVCILGITIYYYICGIMRKIHRVGMTVLFILQILTMGAAGYLEYLVQRHGDRASGIYLYMTAACVFMVILPCIIGAFSRKKPGNTKESQNGT